MVVCQSTQATKVNAQLVRNFREFVQGFAGMTRCARRGCL